MKKTHLYIKGMCCDRCIETVKQLLGLGNYIALKATLGEVKLANSLSEKELDALNSKLAAKGFTIVNSHAEKIITKAKTSIFQYLNDVVNKDIKTRLSDYVEKKVGLNYYHISRVFSSAEKMTLEKFLISLKIERVKEMLLQNEPTISQIAYQLGYSSTQSLSTQFKKNTGKTLGEYKLDPVPGRVHFDKIKVQNFIQTGSD